MKRSGLWFAFGAAALLTSGTALAQVQYEGAYGGGGPAQQVQVVVPAPDTAQQSVPQAAPDQVSPQGQWVYTADSGWIWVPTGASSYAVGETPYTYIYTPAYGWNWYVSPWGWGPYAYGPWVRGPWGYGWRGFGARGWGARGAYGGFHGGAYRGGGGYHGGGAYRGSGGFHGGGGHGGGHR